METKTPIWVGEFGPVYTGHLQADAMRYQLLRDQLDIYTHYQANWAIWTYKDIGLQGVVFAAPDSLWMQRIRPFEEKKARLGTDCWGGLDTHIRYIMEPLEQTFAAEFPTYNPFPFGAQWQINRLVRHILLSEALLPEFGVCFKDVTEGEIDAMMQSFHFRNCSRRAELVKVLADYA